MANTIKTLSLSIICLLAVACSQSFAEQGTLQQPGDSPEQLLAEAIISQHKNSTDEPPAWGHYKKWSTDALLMGNGDMGLSVGGEAESLRFWINKTKGIP